MDAAEHKKFDVANLTLQTFVNTYPNSEYAAKARLKLQDPQIAHCGQVEQFPFKSFPECNPEVARQHRRSEWC
jgi:hypothetical protein